MTKLVVADTSPLNYLVLINQINLLPQLYVRVLIPESVLEELTLLASIVDRSLAQTKGD